MFPLSLKTRLARRGTAVALGAAVALGGAATLPATALATHSQASIIEDFNVMTDPVGTLTQFRALGANTVRVILPWEAIAPSPSATKKPNFNATDPNAYSAERWAAFDTVVNTAHRLGLNVDLTVAGGAPRWAEAQAAPRSNAVNNNFVAWKPNAADYGQFVQAVGRRYSGTFVPKGQSTPLPRVNFWAIFNEPNFGQDLGPQAINGSRSIVSPMYYRSLVNAGWHALQASGHGRDTILIGEIAAEGSLPHTPTRLWPEGLPGNYGQTRALLFVRDLYCVDSRYRPLRGAAASSTGCPTTSAGIRKFRSQNPGLFSASGFADHPYDGGQSPVSQIGNKVDYATFVDFGNLERTLDGVNRAYGSGKRYPIYNTEYGEITNPPKRGYPSPATAAYYINWAEYLSWKSGRVASYMQYLLRDPAPNTGVYNEFASGLEFSNGKQKATWPAYQLPVFMPFTSFSRNANEEIWGNTRPAPFMSKDGHGAQTVAIQVDGRTVRTTGANGGYFDLRMKFPAGRHTVRLAYTFPKQDAFLPVSDLGKTIYSRSFTINVH
jgi:hypothetical protein